MIDGATMVALSEAVHGAAEPLEFRNRVLKYLVEHRGFTAIAIESGVVESRAVHDFVRGGSGELATVVADGFSWHFERFAQNQELARWLREHNARSGAVRPVNFYGFDVSGSPGNPRAARGLDLALRAAFRYLATVDRLAYDVLLARLGSLLPHIHFDFCRLPETPGYDLLTASERDTLTATITDLMDLFERRETEYIAASTLADYEWGHRCAVGAGQVDQWLRKIPLDWRPTREPPQFPGEQTRFFSDASAVRDRAQADNLAWIVQREGREGKILVFASRIHLSATPVRAAWFGPNNPAQAVAGVYLRRRYGERLLTVCHLVGGGKHLNGNSEGALPPPIPGSLDDLAGEVGEPEFLLDLRKAPPRMAQWLDKEQVLGPADHALRLRIGRGFDVLWYLGEVTPACGVAP